MKKIIINQIEYEVEEDYKNAFNQTDFEEKYTDYFEEYDYILGDYSYDKLRLKGFCVKQNKKYNPTNDYEKIKEYLENYCSYECRYFILKKNNLKNA